MARDISDTTPIESRDELVAYLEGGSKPRDHFRIGTEHEKFAYRRSDLRLGLGKGRGCECRGGGGGKSGLPDEVAAIHEFPPGAGV